MKFAELFPIALTPVAPFPADHGSQYAVCMPLGAVTFLRLQLDRDINAKALGWMPSPYRLYQLIDLMAMLPGETCNVVLSTEQMRLLLDYSLRQWEMSFADDDVVRVNAYQDLVNAITPATVINFQFPLSL